MNPKRRLASFSFVRSIDSQPSRHDLIAAGVLVALLLGAYAMAFGAGFVWDDDSHVTANPVIVGPEGLPEIWTTTAANYFPLTLTHFWVQHALWGLHPLGYHVVTFACHAIAALLLWSVLRRLAIPGAWLGAALWGLHPVQVESAAWISELKNTQSAIFFLLAVRLWLTWSERREDTALRLYFLSLAAAVCALLSKPSTVMLPMALALCSWWRSGRLSRRELLALAPFLACSLLASGWAIWEQRVHSGAEGAEWQLSFAQRLIVAGKAFWFYLGKLIWPAGLTFIYPRWTIDSSSLAAWTPFLFATAVAGAVGWRLWQNTATGRGSVFGLSFFALLLFPVLGLFNVYFFRYSYVADHFQYLASIGPLAWAGAAIATLPRILVRPIAAFALLVASCLTWQHTRTFVSNEALWRATIAQNPAAPMAWLNLGKELARQGRHSEAIATIKHAAEIQPSDADSHNDTGWHLIDLGYVEEAVPSLQSALQLAPTHAEAHKNLGNAQRKLGRIDLALSHYRHALELAPNSTEAQVNVGSALAESGRFVEALPYFEAALRVAPDYVPAYVNLGIAQGLQRNWPAAIAALEKAATLKPAHPGVQASLGAALANAGRLDDAARRITLALEQDPTAIDVRRNYAQLLEAMGRTAEAAAQRALIDQYPATHPVPPQR